eukprot:tig00000042_g15539.t1
MTAPKRSVVGATLVRPAAAAHVRRVEGLQHSLISFSERASEREQSEQRARSGQRSSSCQARSRACGSRERSSSIEDFRAFNIRPLPLRWAAAALAAAGASYSAGDPKPVPATAACESDRDAEAAPASHAPADLKAAAAAASSPAAPAADSCGGLKAADASAAAAAAAECDAKPQPVHVISLDPEEVSLDIPDSPGEPEEPPAPLGAGPPLEELRALQLREARSVAQLAALLRLVAAGEAAARRMDCAADGPAGRALQLPVVQAAAGASELQKLAAARQRLRRLCERALSAFAETGAPGAEDLADLAGVKGAGLADHDDLARLELVAAALAALEAAAAAASPAQAEARRLSHEAVVKPLSARLKEIAKQAEAAGSWRAEAAAYLAREALVRASSDYDRFGDAVRRAKAAMRVLEKLYRAGKLVAEGVASFGVTTVIDAIFWIKENRGDAREALREMWSDVRTIAGADHPKKAEAWFVRARLVGTLAERGRLEELRALLDAPAMAEVARSRKLALALCAALVAVRPASQRRKDPTPTPSQAVERADDGGRAAAAADSAVKLLEACAEAAAGLKDGAASLRAAAAALAHVAALDSVGSAPAAALQALRRLAALEAARAAVEEAAAHFSIGLEAGAGPARRLKPAARVRGTAHPSSGTAGRSALVLAALKAEEERNPEQRLSDVLSGAREELLDRYREEMESDLYVPARAAADIDGRLAADEGRRFDLDAALDAFAASGAAPGGSTAGHRVLLLTGDSGCSKTTSLRRLHRRLLEQWRPAAGSPFPVLVSLPAVTVSELDLVEELVAKAGLHDGDRELREALQQRVKLLALLDGFDETGKSDALHILFPKLKSWAARVVVACRAQYLPSLGADPKSFFLLDSIGAPKQVCEAWTCPFNRDQIGAYVGQWLAANPDPERGFDWYMKQINTILGLLDIIRTPFVLSIACKELPSIDKKMQEKQKEGSVRVLLRDVYDAFVAGLFKREEEKRVGQGRFKRFAVNCRNFCRALAILMDQLATTVLTVDLQLSFGVLNLKKRHTDADETEPDPTAKAAMLLTSEKNQEFIKASPLKTVSEGDGKASYSFVHASLKEYFLADSILPYLDARLAANTSAAAGSLRRPSATWMGSGAGVVGGLGRRLLVDDSAVMRFLADRARSDPPFVEALWECVRKSVQDDSQIALFAAANAMTILNHAGTSFAGKELRGIRVPGADLFRLEAAGADLRGADLSGALLDDANLAGADLRGADLTGCRLSVRPACEMDSAVLSVAVARDGRYIVAGCSAGAVCFVDVETNREVRRMQASDRYRRVLSVALSADCTMLGWGGENAVVELWNFEDGTRDQPRILKLEGHTDWVISVAFSPDGATLASGSRDKTVRLWSTADGTSLRTLKGHAKAVHSVAFSPDGAVLVSGGGDMAARLWSATDGTELRVLKPEERILGIQTAAFSSDGQTLAFGCLDGSVQLWSAANGALLFSLKGHANSVSSVSFSPDGATLASGSDDRTVRLWRVADGTLVRVLGGHEARVTSVAFLPDGRSLMSGGYDETVRFWGMHQADGHGALLHVSRSGGHKGPVTALVFTSDAKTLVSHGDSTIRFWSVADGASHALNIIELERHIDRIRSWVVSLSPDCKSLALGTWRGNVRLYCAVDGALRCVFEGHKAKIHSVAFSPDGKMLASGSEDGTARLWNTVDQVLLCILEGHALAFTCLAFSPDCTTLVSGSSDKTLRLWSVADGATLGIFKGHTGGIISVAFSPDGKTLASGSYDGTARMWSVAKNNVLHVLGLYEDNGVGQAVAFSPDGETLASGGADGSVRLWSVASGALLHVLRGHMHMAGISAVAFAPDGKTLASGSDDRSIRLWSMAGAAPVSIRRLGAAMPFDPHGAIADAATWAHETLRRVFAQGGGVGWLLDPPATCAPPAPSISSPASASGCTAAGDDAPEGAQESNPCFGAALA